MGTEKAWRVYITADDSVFVMFSVAKMKARS